MSVGVEERGKKERRESEKEGLCCWLMAAVGEAFQAECGDEAGLYSHGIALHCKHCEGTRQRSPAEMWRGGEHVGKFWFLAHSQLGSQSVLKSVSTLASPAISRHAHFASEVPIRSVRIVASHFNESTSFPLHAKHKWKIRSYAIYCITDCIHQYLTSGCCWFHPHPPPKKIRKTPPQSAFAPLLCLACQQSFLCCAIYVILA